ncbi:hypothetical protein ACWEWU_13200 [Staphylococcus xylosus]
MKKYNILGEDFWDNLQKSLSIPPQLKLAFPKCEIKFTVSENKLNNYWTNLFSEKALNNFIELSSFSEDEILKMNNAFRNFNVNCTSGSTLTKTINSPHPIEKPKRNEYYSELKGIMDKHIVTPSKELINNSTKIVFADTIADFVLRLVRQEPVDTSIYVWVLFFSYLGYLISRDNNDIKN